MRTLGRLAMVVLLVGLFIGVPRAAIAQGGASTQIATRGPLFLRPATNAGARSVDRLVDASNAAVFQRRIALELRHVSRERALAEIARRGGLRLTYSAAVVRLDAPVTLVAADLTVGAALSAVLYDAGVDVLLTENGRAALVRRMAPVMEQGGTVTGRVTDGKNGQELEGVDVSLEDTRWRTTTDADGRYRLAEVTPGRYTVLARRIGYAPERRAVTVTAGQETAVDVVALQPGSTKLGDITVTANRREQRVQDVAGTLQVFPGGELERNGAEGFEDYLLSVPGVSFRDQGNGANRIALRGVSNVIGNDFDLTTASTVGIYLNDVPVQGFSIAPDMALYDIERIEVLKGPQGTLYGEGAMGGAIKMVLNAPNLSEFEGKADLSSSSIHGGGFGYRVRGAANLPLVGDRLALRLAGTYVDESGFVDNITRGEKDHDGDKVYSMRGVLAAAVTNTLSAEVLAFHNVTKLDDYPQIVPALGGLQISSSEDRFNDAKGTLLGLTLKNDFGFAELTSVTSHYGFDRTFTDRVQFGSFFFGAFGPVTQEPYLGTTNLDAFAQEFRFVSQGDHQFDWVLGAFYRDKKTKAINDAWVVADELGAVNAGLAGASLPPLGADGLFFHSTTIRSYEQYAIYGEGKLGLGDRFELTVGARWFDEKVRLYDSFQKWFSYVAFLSGDTPEVPLRDRGVTPKFAVSYEASDDNIIYANVAKGFRSSALNGNFGFAGDEGAASDNLWSYEIGSKNTFADGRVIVNGSAFYLDWRDMQALALVEAVFTLDSFPVVENAGTAEMYGFEAELAAAVTDRFTFGAALGYTHSELTATRGNYLVGAELPNTPKWTGAGYAEYGVPVSIGRAFARFDVKYTDKQATSLITADAAGNVTNAGGFVDSYAIGNVRLGLDSEKGWGLMLFADNVWDERAVLGRGLQGLGTANAERVSISRPRAIGLSVSKTF